MLTPEIKKEIEQAIDVSDIALHPLSGGTNDRTFLAKTNKGEFIVRYETVGGVQLRRAFNAQKKAEDLGVKVPKVINHNLDERSKDLWVIEQKIDGEQFYPDLMGEKEMAETSRDLGRQLKLLHSLECDKFGLIPPYPFWSHAEWKEANDEEQKRTYESLGPVFDTYQEHIEKKRSKIEKAFDLSGVDKKYIDQVKEVYAVLKDGYSGKSIFCGGDTATTNILVKDGKIQAIIDWEWAQGSDPAENVAAWSYWNKTTKPLDHFLEGYNSNDPTFKKRVLLNEIIEAINLILVYKDMKKPAEMKKTGEILENLLNEKAWEKI